ncbi:two-component system, cell cycle response regulator [Marinagarivorans cellulosilyticus]|uniref:diguanylate cyclase n=2 Tax=Marinagarivorans cellulosilyticus TaxID=2721545 RepID=A0AAN1WE64_9GAMM|nr:two-component system, cell cycle response regulator [Marinagarivorans cellulosilyticus]
MDEYHKLAKLITYRLTGFRIDALYDQHALWGSFMQVPVTFKAVFLGALASLTCILAVDHLPERRTAIYPAPNLSAHNFVEPTASGQVSWTNEEKLHFQCNMISQEGYSNCGINISLKNDDKNFDLSEYDAIYLKAKLDSPEKWLRLFTDSWLNEYSTTNANAIQIAQALIRATDLTQGVTIDLRRISIPDWWIQRFTDAPIKYTYPHFSETTAIGLVLGAPMELGAHDIKLEEIAFVGRLITVEELYPILLAAWLAAFLLSVLLRFITIQKRLAQERLATQTLSQESEKYKKLSMTDPLTGVLNRNGLEAALSDFYKDLQENEQVTLLVLDLDHFKNINDKCGHDIGDLVLKRTAKTLQNNIRQSDYLARWGGEEFIIAVRNTEATGALILAETLRQRIAALDFAIDPSLKVTISIGITTFSANDEFEQAFKCADDALYQAKHKGRNCAVLGQEITAKKKKLA